MPLSPINVLSSIIPGFPINPARDLGALSIGVSLSHSCFGRKPEAWLLNADLSRAIQIFVLTLRLTCSILQTGLN